MTTRISGQLFSGQRSSAEAVDLIVDGESASFQAQSAEVSASSRSYALKDLRFSPRLGQIPRTIETADGFRFETSDFAGIEKIEKENRSTTFVLHLENRWSYVALVAASLVLTLVLFVTVAIPKGAYFLAPMVPQSVAEQMSKPMELLWKADSPKVLTSFSGAAFDRFQAAEEDLHKIYPQQGPIDFIDTKAPNAFVLPNGHMFVTKGLVNLSKTSDQLLAVMLHERGHNVLHHVMQAMIENSTLSAVIILVTGGTEWSNVPILILDTKYSRLNELQADSYAVTALKSARKDPESLATMFELMKKETEVGDVMPTFLSTHPSIDERIEAIRRMEKM